MPRDASPTATLLDAIRTIRQLALAREAAARAAIDAAEVDWRASAANLAHYVALRSTGHVALQADLVRHGLSSLSRREAHVMATLDAVESTLARAEGERPTAAAGDTAGAIDASAAIAERHAQALLGPPEPHTTRIVVTLPPWSADDPSFMTNLLEAGMDVARLNASHGDEAQWRATLGALRAAAAAKGRRVPVFLDLPGPKVRTGECASGPVALVRGDTLVLHAADGTTTDGARDGEGRLVSPPRVAVRPREIVEAIAVGDRVLFDDGNIRGRCAAVDRAKGEATVAIEAVRAGAWTLKDRKGVNVPDTDLPIPAVTARDREILRFATGEGAVDAVAVSFVRTARDIADALAALDALGAGTTGVIAKIETPQACRALPSILHELMKRPPAGAMLARGDLGVEVGFENLPEAQDEILALCEAAHMPVIWATQVLESMTEHGFPTRGEVTDAADAARADAVMLGIGPFMVETVQFTEDLLGRTKLRRARSRALLTALPRA